MAVLARFVLASLCRAGLEFLLIFCICKANLKNFAVLSFANLLAMELVDNLLTDFWSFESMHIAQHKDHNREITDRLGGLLLT